MNTRIVRVVARLPSLLPLRANQLLGRWLGRIAWLLRSKPRRITEFNLRHCFPTMDDAERQALARDSLKHTGQQLLECAWVWHRPVSQTLPRIRESVGEHWLTDALESPQGVIVLSPHVGNWEICTLALSQRAEFTYFYRSPRNDALQSLILEWRAHLGGKPATLDSSGIRKGLRILRQGGLVGILPDQEPDRENGVFAPFFQQPALTMTLLPRLAARSNARVILMVAERLPRAQGWRVHFLPASPDIASADPVVAATAVNRDVERCIAICPAQYLWDYKRFNTLPDGTRRRYPAIS